VLVGAGILWQLFGISPPLTVHLDVISNRADAPNRDFPPVPPIHASDGFRFVATASRPVFLCIIGDDGDGCKVLATSGRGRVKNLAFPGREEWLHFVGSDGPRMILTVASDKPFNDTALTNALHLKADHVLQREDVITWLSPRGLRAEGKKRT